MTAIPHPRPVISYEALAESIRDPFTFRWSPVPTRAACEVPGCGWAFTGRTKAEAASRASRHAGEHRSALQLGDRPGQLTVFDALAE